MERDEALRNIDLQIEEARLSGDMQKAEALSAYKQQVASLGLSIAQTNASIAQSAADSAYARSRDVVEDKRYAEDKNVDAISNAIALIDKGFTPDVVAKIFNLSPEVVSAINGYYARQII